MKKVTFPHMGNLKIPAKTFLQELGLEVIVPPKNSKKTLDLGVKYSPEFACLPLKINLGNFIEALKKGAEVIIMGGGCGPCRFGYYGEVQREILKELGYDFEMVVLEPNLFEDYHNLRYLFSNVSLKKIYQAGKLTWAKITAMDKIEKTVIRERAREKERGQLDQLYQTFLRKLEKIMSVEKTNRLTNNYLEAIKDSIAEYKLGKEIRIGIVGEIYLVIEPFVNLEIEKKLGQLGASVSKEIYISNWILHFLHLNNEMKLIKQAATPYLNSFVGGHGIDSIGNTVKYARSGYDGIIQLAPFTCMPEVVAQTILPVVSQKEGIPVLSLFFDEHSGDAGLVTRLEAFIDLLVRKKEQLAGQRKEIRDYHG